MIVSIKEVITIGICESIKTAVSLFLRYNFVPHYLIIGHYTKKPIGCTYGKRGQMEALAKDPKITFRCVALNDCPMCQRVRMDSANKSQSS